ncbi:MAG: biopolymer transporter ExbD [Gammaproteobacteria bacterium]|nr:biopolymer transporter ExbD [Gammaproteobacteria bacterium]
MSRRRGRHAKEAPELDITAFLNLMVVLVPFLLVSAVFSRITILELNMPSGAASSTQDKPKVTIEVIVRKNSLELSDGRRVIARFPKIPPEVKDESEDLVTALDAAKSGELEDVYDTRKLSAALLKIKGNYPEKLDATVLMESDIQYEYLVLVMDAVRSAEVIQEGQEQVQKLVLFPEISIGDAP